MREETKPRSPFSWALFWFDKRFDSCHLHQNQNAIETRSDHQHFRLFFTDSNDPLSKHASMFPRLSHTTVELRLHCFGTSNSIWCCHTSPNSKTLTLPAVHLSWEKFTLGDTCSSFESVTHDNNETHSNTRRTILIASHMRVEKIDEPKGPEKRETPHHESHSIRNQQTVEKKEADL